MLLYLVNDAMLDTTNLVLRKLSKVLLDGLNIATLKGIKRITKFFVTETPDQWVKNGIKK